MGKGNLTRFRRTGHADMKAKQELGVEDKKPQSRGGKKRDAFLDLPVEQVSPTARPPVTQPPLFGRHFRVSSVAVRLYRDMDSFYGVRSSRDPGLFMTYYRLYHLFCQQRMRRMQRPPHKKAPLRGALYVTVRGVRLVNYDKLRPPQDFSLSMEQFYTFINTLHDCSRAAIANISDLANNGEAYRQLSCLRRNPTICSKLLYNCGPDFVSGGTCGNRRLFSSENNCEAQAFYEALGDGFTNTDKPLTDVFCDFLLENPTVVWTPRCDAWVEYVSRPDFGFDQNTTNVLCGEWTGDDDLAMVVTNVKVQVVSDFDMLPTELIEAPIVELETTRFVDLELQRMLTPSMVVMTSLQRYCYMGHLSTLDVVRTGSIGVLTQVTKFLPGPVRYLCSIQGDTTHATFVFDYEKFFVSFQLTIRLTKTMLVKEERAVRVVDRTRQVDPTWLYLSIFVWYHHGALYGQAHSYPNVIDHPVQQVVPSPVFDYTLEEGIHYLNTDPFLAMPRGAVFSADYCRTGRQIANNRLSVGYCANSRVPLNGEVTGLDDMSLAELNPNVAALNVACLTTALPSTTNREYRAVGKHGKIARVRDAYRAKTQRQPMTTDQAQFELDRQGGKRLRQPAENVVVKETTVDVVPMSDRPLVTLDTPTTSEPPQPPAPTGFRLVVCPSAERTGVAYDQSGVVIRRSENVWVGQTRTYCVDDIVQPDIKLEGVRQSQPGWVEYGGKNVVVTSSAYLPPVTFPAYVDMNIDQLPKTYEAQTFIDILHPIAQKLAVAFPSCEQKAHTLPSMMAAITNGFPLIASHTELIRHHMDYFTRRMLYLCHVVRRKLVELPNSDPLMRVANYNRNVVKNGGYWTWEAVDSIEKKYGDNNTLLRADVQFTKIKGSTYVDQINGEIVPRFVDRATRKRYYHTNFIRFSGVTPFSLYSVNGRNMIRGLARIVRKREDYKCGDVTITHDTLVHNQSALGAALLRDGLISPSSAAAVNTKVTFIKTTLPVKHKRDQLLEYAGLVDEDGTCLSYDTMSVDIATQAVITQYGGKPVKYTAALPHMQVADDTRWYGTIRSVIDELRRRSTPGMLDLIQGIGVTAATTLYDSAIAAKTWLMDCMTRRDIVTSLPHPKKALRRKFFNDSEIHNTTLLLTDRVEANVKKEIGKYGKLARLFVGYGAGCIAAPELPEYLKHAFLQPIEYTVAGVHVTIFVIGKPCAVNLTDLYRTLYEMLFSGVNQVYSVIFSDDSVLCGVLNGQKFGVNVDISSCDSSNGWTIFAIVGSLMGQVDEDGANALLRQCCQPIKVTNPDDPNDSFNVELSGPFEGSGTVLTTVLNHTASVLISVSSIDMLVSQMEAGEGVDVVTALTLGGARVGHQVSIVDWCENGVPVFEKMDFLKTHPVLGVDGQWHAMRCLGALFRGFGSIDGDIDALKCGMSIQQFREVGPNNAFLRYASGVIEGLKNEPDCKIMAAMRSRFLDKSGFCKELDVFKARSQAAFVADDDSINRRYEINESQVNELVSAIQDSDIGMEFTVDALSLIFRKDYGVEF